MHPRNNTIETVDSDETKLAEALKHPIGIIILYIQATFGMILAIGLAYFLLPVVLGDEDTAFFIGNLFAGVSVVLTALVVMVATIIYRQNRLIITDRNITQILQYGLFNRKVSQLNMNNVEDVTAIQQGFLSTIFNYGTLKIETAGEQMNFKYTYCPNVSYHAKIILEAREKVLGQHDNDSVSTTAFIAGQKSNSEPDVNLKGIGSHTIKQAQQQK